MAMAGKRVQRDVTDDTQIGAGGLDSTHRAADEIVTVEGKTTIGIF